MNKFLFALVLLIGCSSTKVSAETITVSAMNIRYYGSAGKQGGDHSLEMRDPTLREFFQKNLAKSDVVAFEEIVDVPRLIDKVIPGGWKCISYDHPNPEHQHVVLCHSPAYSLEKDPGDDNFIIEDVAINPERSRPAIHAIVKDRRGNKVARVVAVHLKAYPFESQTRIKQTNVIADVLSDVADKALPVVILGDFNTYAAPANKQVQNDTELMEEIYNDRGLNLARVNTDGLYTYRTAKIADTFDHVFYSKSMTAPQKLRVDGFCNMSGKESDFLEKINWYYENISDHCAVTATFKY